MDRDAVIKALQSGLAEALEMIKYLKTHGNCTDPGIAAGVDQLEQLLNYSGYIYDAHPSKKHPLYSN